MSDNPTNPPRNPEKVELSIQLDSEVVDQIKHLTNDPSRVIETAIKQWLRGEKGDGSSLSARGAEDLSRRFMRNPPVPPRGEWND
jgi:hypothetical protein